MKVLVIGDANVDLEIMLPNERSGEHANPEPRLFGGGSAANTASALASLGIPTAFAGTVGDDSFGRHAVRTLSDVGVDVSDVVVADSEPTVAVIVVVPTDGDRLIYVWPPRGGAHRLLSTDTTVRALDGTEWLHVSGLCLRVLPARETLITTMQEAQRRGITVSFDLNLRLENWGWDDDFRRTVWRAVEASDVVLGAGHDEISPLAGEEGIYDALRIIAGASRTVIARLGPQGAIGFVDGAIHAEAAIPTTPVDTVGAGDAFNAGFIAARTSGKSFDDALTWGNAVASLAIRRRGARASVSLSELETLLKD